MNSSPLDNEKAVALVHHFAGRLFLVFSYAFFKAEFKNELSLLQNPKMYGRGLRIPAIHDACVNTTLMAIRDLDEFFTPHKSRTDDVKASDLGLGKDLKFLSKSERENINKMIMHSTTVAAYANQPIQLDVGELSSKCVSQSFYFFKWVKENYKGKNQQQVWAAATFYTELISTLPHIA
jgi:hypothetical protein